MGNDLFLNEIHKENYYEFLDKDKTKENDFERKSMFYILAKEEIYNHIEEIYNFKRHELNLDFIESLQELNINDRKLIYLALNLYNNFNFENWNWSVVELFMHQDNFNIKVIINGILIRFNRKTII